MKVIEREVSEIIDRWLSDINKVVDMVIDGKLRTF